MQGTVLESEARSIGMLISRPLAPDDFNGIKHTDYAGLPVAIVHGQTCDLSVATAQALYYVVLCSAVLCGAAICWLPVVNHVCCISSMGHNAAGLLKRYCLCCTAHQVMHLLFMSAEYYQVVEHKC